VVLQEHTVAPGGKHVEVLGSYDPYSKKAVLKGDRVRYWIGKGAQLSDTVHNLFVRENILAGKEKRAVKMPKPVAKEVAAEAPKDEKVVSVITPSEKKETVKKAA
jgi:small subunit ribosomal protein S16